MRGRPESIRAGRACGAKALNVGMSTQVDTFPPFSVSYEGQREACLNLPSLCLWARYSFLMRLQGRCKRLSPCGVGYPLSHVKLRKTEGFP